MGVTFLEFVCCEMTIFCMLRNEKDEDLFHQVRRSVQLLETSDGACFDTAKRVVEEFCQRYQRLCFHQLCTLHYFIRMMNEECLHQQHQTCTPSFTLCEILAEIPKNRNSQSEVD